MKTYEIGLVPGPVSVPEEFRMAYLENFGSADLEEEFFHLYEENEALLRDLLKTKNSVTIQSGEAMSVLWGALKSLLLPGDRLLAVSNGVFGRGFGEMGKMLGMEVRIVEAQDGEFPDLASIREAAAEFRPRMITAVHCETPSGILNPLSEIGKIARETGALFCVDYVASAGGTDVRTDEWEIDVGLLGSQKVLSLLPDLSMVALSDRAWEAAERTIYQGYDALLPWRDGPEKRYLPYTHNWHALQALNLSLRRLFDEGLERSFARHDEVARYCRGRLSAMDVVLYPKSEELCSPTVTAALVPSVWTWSELDGELRSRGMVVGGSYGALAGKVFRIGHMGSQADMELVKRGMDILEDVLKNR
jgi:aspartate aminotransferase-like enzyme